MGPSRPQKGPETNTFMEGNFSLPFRIVGAMIRTCMALKVDLGDQRFIHSTTEAVRPPRKKNIILLNQESLMNANIFKFMLMHVSYVF